MDPGEDPEVLRYKKFINPPEAYWMCFEPGAAGGDPLTTPDECQSDVDCEVLPGDGATCQNNVCVTPAANEYQLWGAGVPGTVTSNPAVPLTY